MLRALLIGVLGFLGVLTIAGAGGPTSNGGLETLMAGEPTGRLAISSAADGSPIFEIPRMKPGQTVRARTAVRNRGSVRANLMLGRAGLIERAGPNGGELSSVLRLRVIGLMQHRSVGPPVARRTVYRGPLDRLTGRRVGSFSPGTTRRFQFVVRFPDGGRPRSPRTGDNLYQASSVELDFLWVAARRAEGRHRSR